MTKAAYLLIADALTDAFNAADTQDEINGVNIAMHKIATALKQDNPNFDPVRFIRRVCNG